MNLLSALIVILPLIGILYMAFRARYYVKDVADYLACGRVAGRYVIAVGDMAAGLSVITFVAAVESNYQVGMAIGFWNAINTPLAVFMSLTGYCIYRFRQTRCLSLGQFLELRYSRTFRIVAATIRTIAEMISNAIGPAVAVRFFIYFLGIPHRIQIFGLAIPTYGVLVAVLLCMALAIIWPAGRISLLITDSIQAMMSYPIFVIMVVFILTQISWFKDVAPVMLDREPGESFLNPMDIQNLRDFNLFALFVTMISNVLNRAAWIGNDTSGSARTPHEQKMAGILGTWRNGFSFTMMNLITIFVITFMLSSRFAPAAREVRVRLTEKVAEEVIANPEIRAKVVANVAEIPVATHVIGQDPPYSRKSNPDTPYLDTVLNTLREEMGGQAGAHGEVAPSKGSEHPNLVFQKFRSLYNQMMMPTLLGGLLSPVLIGLFTLLMVMLLISTDDSRIFNASSTIIQDIVIPLKKRALSIEEHMKYLKLCTLGVTIFFFVVSMFFSQLDFIQMFLTLMTSLWLGAAGPIMIGGLYSRFGNTVGAWCALIFGSGTSLVGLVLQRNWAGTIYPWLEAHGLVERVGRFLEAASRPFHPWVVWKMDATKFPVNSMEIYFMAMVLGCTAYVVGSLLSRQPPYNLDRLLHRGIYAPPEDVVAPKQKVTLRRKLFNTLIGITPEYTRGDRIIAWSVFLWSIGWGFFTLFCGSLIWNAISPWPARYWGVYFYITTIVASMIVGTISTVWFLIGGFRDLRAMFRDLKARVANPLDDGRVVGHVSLADLKHFEEIEHQKEGDPTAEQPSAKQD